MATKAAKKEKGLTYTIKESPRAHRTKLGKNQSEYWKPLGVTQSGGSRYESGRSIPASVRTLRELVYGSKPNEALAFLRGVTVEELIAKGK